MPISPEELSAVRPIVEQMTADRGWLVNSYAQIEFLLADLIVRCRQLAPYADLASGKLPRDLKARSALLLQILQLAGPLRRFQSEMMAARERWMSVAQRLIEIMFGLYSELGFSPNALQS